MYLNLKFSFRSECYSIIGTLYAGAAFFIAFGAQSQNLFVSELGKGYNNITEITPSGERSTFASLPGAWGLAFDARGDLFVANDASGEIDEFISNNGALSSTPTLFASGLNGPEQLAIDSAGDVFVSSFNFGTIIKITPDGTQSTFASGLNDPSGLALNSAGDLFEADWGSGKIYMFTPGGLQSTFASGVWGANALTFDNVGNMFLANQSYNKITEITPQKVQSTFASGLSPEPFDLAFDNTGDLLVTEPDSGNVIKITPDGTQSTFASGLSEPLGLAIEVPEPPALALLALGATTLLAYFRKRLPAHRK
jgi:hypothetical protein